MKSVMNMDFFSVFLVLYLMINPTLLKLVVDNLDDLMIGEGDDLTYDIQRIISEGVLTNKTLQESECPGVMEEIQIWEVMTREEGEEVSNLLEVSKLIDLITDTMQVTNIREPWVRGSVLIR